MKLFPRFLPLFLCLIHTLLFGCTDNWGWTDSTQYQGFEYDVSRFSANVARGAAAGLVTAGVGNLAAAGNAVAKVGYGGLLAINAAQGGYQVGNGINSAIDGNYLLGAGQIVGGSLAVAGSISGARTLVNATAMPSIPPGKGWEWRGSGDIASGKGSWYNPKTGASLHPDLNHAAPIGPHYDYVAPNGTKYRIFPDGTRELK